MRFPRVRLAVPRLSLDWLSGLMGRSVVLYALYTLVVFLIFLVINFPHDVLVQRVLREVDLRPLRLDIAAARFAWWKGYELRGVRLTRIGDDRGTPPLLEGSNLYVRPGFSELIRGRLGSAYLTALMYKGVVEGSWVTNDGTNRATLRLDGLDIGSYRFLTNALEDGQIGGRLSGAVTVEARRANLREAQAAGELELQDAQLTSLKVNGFPVPDLKFQTVAVKFAAGGNKLDVQEFRAEGNELRLGGSGQVTVRAPLRDSVLNLKLTAQPGPESNDTVKGFLNLLPKPKGARPEAPVSITGTIAQPKLR